MSSENCQPDTGAATAISSSQGSTLLAGDDDDFDWGDYAYSAAFRTGLHDPNLREAWGTTLRTALMRTEVEHGELVSHLTATIVLPRIITLTNSTDSLENAQF